MLYAQVLNKYLLKLMRKPEGLPNDSASTNGARELEDDANSVKTHAPAHRILTPKAPEQKDTH